MALTFRALLVAGALGVSTIMAAPAAAAPVPAGGSAGITTGSGLGSATAVFDYSRYDAAAEAADWRCRGWGCGGRGWRRNRVDAGDVLVGAVVIGGLAAILSSNNRRERERDVVVVERDRDIRDRDFRRDADPRYRDDRRASPRGTGSSGLDSAVDMCLSRIERDVRVDTVDNVERNAAGWRVSGSLFNGTGFQCRIGSNGQIDGIDYDGSFGAGDWGTRSDLGAATRGAGQWDDSSYASARAAVGGTVRPDMAVQEAPMQVAQAPQRSFTTTAMPAYPGGPIPGEEIPETVDGDL